MAKSKTVIQALVVMALWGLLFPLVKLGYNAYSIESTGDILLFAGVRFTICGAIICAYSFLRERESLKTVKPVLVPVLISGFFAIVLHYGFSYGGLMLTDSSKTAILKQAGSIIYVCFSWMFFRDDKVTAKKITGVLLGFAGIVAINTTGQGITFTLGDALIITSSVCLMVANIISKKVFSTVSPIVSTGVSQLFGGIVLLIVGLVSGGSMTVSGGSGSITLLAIVIASIISYCLWYINVARGNLSNLFIIKFAEPVFAAVFGALLLSENILRPQYTISFVLIAAGIYISNR